MHSSDTEDQESPSNYCAGGFHPVQIGDVFQDKYLVTKKLGWGNSSTVWLCWDCSGKKFVAVKVMRSAPAFAEFAIEEIYLLKYVRKHDSHNSSCKRIVQLLDYFEICGRNGRHICMVFEFAGYSLRKLIKNNNNGISLQNVKQIIRQVLEGLDFLHTKCKVIHTDIKPENIMISIDKVPNNEELSFEGTDLLDIQVSLSPISREPNYFTEPYEQRQDTTRFKKDRLDESNSSPITEKTSDEEFFSSVDVSSQDSNLQKMLGEAEVNSAEVSCQPEVKIIDLGNSCWVDQQASNFIQTRHYRCLEILLGTEYNTSADIWSVACIAFELATGKILFNPCSRENCTTDEEHLALIINLLGPIPQYIIDRGQHSPTFFNQQYQLKCDIHSNPLSLENVLIRKHHWSEREAKPFAAFLEPMLHFDPGKRTSASDCLIHEWLWT